MARDVGCKQNKDARRGAQRGKKPFTAVYTHHLGAGRTGPASQRAHP
jgi:hypothetical protein